MGVSVKYRDDLRRRFCEPAGRAQLTESFLHYYELSEDRQALAQALVEAGQALQAVQRARQSLAQLEAL